MQLQRAEYLSLATRKRDGSWVNTPVWFAHSGDTYYVFSEGDAGKVKRLRNFSEVRLAPCTMTGALRGDWQDGKGALVSDTGQEAEGYKALRKKYGSKMRLLDLGSRVSGKYPKRQLIAIQLT